MDQTLRSSTQADRTNRWRMAAAGFFNALADNLAACRGRLFPLSRKFNFWWFLPWDPRVRRIEPGPDSPRRGWDGRLTKLLLERTGFETPAEVDSLDGMQVWRVFGYGREVHVVAVLLSAPGQSTPGERELAAVRQVYQEHVDYKLGRRNAEHVIFVLGAPDGWDVDTRAHTHRLETVLNCRLDEIAAGSPRWKTVAPPLEAQPSAFQKFVASLRPLKSEYVLADIKDHIQQNKATDETAVSLPLHDMALATGYNLEDVRAACLELERQGGFTLDGKGDAARLRSTAPGLVRKFLGYLAGITLSWPRRLALTLSTCLTFLLLGLFKALPWMINWFSAQYQLDPHTQLIVYLLLSVVAVVLEKLFLEEILRAYKRM